MSAFTTNYFDEDENAPWQALLGVEQTDPIDSTEAPYSLSDDERFALERSAGFNARDPSTGFRAGKFDFPTSPDDPRFADARRSPIATPDARPLLPEKRPSSVPEVAGPSPMLAQRARENSDNAAWRALAGGGSAQQPSSSGGGGWGDADILIAGLLDTVLNRGRNLPQMVATKQQQELTAKQQGRENELHDMRLAQMRQQMALRATPRAMDPVAEELKRKQLELAGARVDQAGRRLDNAESAYADKQEERAARRDPTSELSRRAQEMAVALGHDELLVRDKTAEQLLQWRPQIGQMLQQERSNKAWADRHGPGGMAEDVQITKEKRTQGYKIDEEERELTAQLNKEGRQADAEAAQFSIPGWRHVEGVKPNKDNAKAAREIVDALGESEAYAKQLEELHAQLGAKAKLGKLSAVLGQGETAKAISDAKIAHQGLLAAQRKLQNMGVPQQYELSMLTDAFPLLDSVDGILRAGDVYASAQAGARAQAGRRLKVYGYEPDSAGDAGRTLRARRQSATPQVAAPPAGDVLDVSPRARATAGNPAVQASTSGGGMVLMVSPKTGVTKLIPADKVEEAEARGFKRVQ